MTRQTVQELVNDVLVKSGFGFEKSFDETKTLEDIGMDSLDVLQFIADCEKKFSLEDLQILTTTSLSHIIDHIFDLKN